MMLIEQTQVPDAALPVAELEAHLRLSSGFGTGVSQEALLMSFLRAALAAIEGWTDKVLIARGFTYTVRSWRQARSQPLPVAPIRAVSAVQMVTPAGAEAAMTAEWYLQADMVRPVLSAPHGAFDAIPTGGMAQIHFTAGFGPTFGDVPADLRQAVLLLAAHYYEYRDETALSEGCMPFGVTALLARYRKMRLGMGA
ncbi:MAG: head-tail connector protein [Paracoccaceae bacterium]